MPATTRDVTRHLFFVACNSSFYLFLSSDSCIPRFSDPLSFFFSLLLHCQHHLIGTIKEHVKNSSSYFFPLLLPVQIGCSSIRSNNVESKNVERKMSKIKISKIKMTKVKCRKQKCRKNCFELQ